MTAPEPANDNIPTARPAAFDARIMAYRPGLRRLASKLGYRGEAANDMVTDTIMYCLEHWQNFREDGGMWNWLYWQMRGQSSNTRNRKGLEMVDSPPKYDKAWLPPNQEDYAELSQTLARMTGRDGGILLRRAMGDELQVIASEMGISRERVRQLEERARAKVREAA